MGRGPGPWAKCADSEGVPCGLPDCRGCKRRAKEKADRERAIEAAAKRLAAQTPEPEAEKPPPELRVVPEPEIPELVGRSVAHQTKEHLPKVSVLRPVPWSWSGWGPPKPEPEQTPEEEASSEVEADREARRANPSPMAQLAASALLRLVQGCRETCEELGRPWPMNDNAKLWDAVFGVLGQSYLGCFAQLLPDIDSPWWADHAVTAGSTAAALGSVQMARKALTAGEATEDPGKAERVEAAKEDRPVVDLVDLEMGEDGVMAEPEGEEGR